MQIHHIIEEYADHVTKMGSDYMKILRIVTLQCFSLILISFAYLHAVGFFRLRLSEVTLASYSGIVRLKDVLALFPICVFVCACVSE